MLCFLAFDLLSKILIFSVDISLFILVLTKPFSVVGIEPFTGFLLICQLLDLFVRERNLVTNLLHLEEVLIRTLRHGCLRVPVN